MTPTELSLRHLRKEGWPLVEVTERWNPHARVRHDLFNLIDVLAVGPQGILGVQTTTDTNVSARVRKIADHPNTATLREAGVALHVHGWSKKNGRYAVRVVDVS
jgi:hypothetical protein